MGEVHDYCGIFIGAGISFVQAYWNSLVPTPQLCSWHDFYTLNLLLDIYIDILLAGVPFLIQNIDISFGLHPKKQERWVIYPK